MAKKKPTPPDDLVPIMITGDRVAQMLEEQREGILKTCRAGEPLDEAQVLQVESLYNELIAYARGEIDAPFGGRRAPGNAAAHRAPKD